MKKIMILLTALMTVTSFSYSATTKVGTPTPSHPNLHQINITLRSEWQQTELGEKDGKITTTQAAALKADLKSVHQQQMAFFKENGNHDLTSSQLSQLNESLNQVEQTLTTAGVPVPTPIASR